MIRNRVRRRLREALRGLLNERAVSTNGADLIIIARPQAATASYVELRDSLAKALARSEFA